MNALGLYLPGSSPVHEMPAGVKLLLLLAAGVGSVFLERAWQVGLALAVVLGCYRLAGLTLRTVLSQVRPLLWVVAAIGLFHGVVNGWERAFVVVGAVTALVLLAGLLTLTTRTSALVDAIVRALGPLRAVGVNAERIGLMLALSIRSVPVVVGLAEEVRQAQLARGLSASPRAFAVPLLVRSLRHADALADALVARGLED